MAKFLDLSGLSHLLEKLQTAFNECYQEKLVSGKTIRTINGTPILGSGNIVIKEAEETDGASVPVIECDGTGFYLDPGYAYYFDNSHDAFSEIDVTLTINDASTVREEFWFTVRTGAAGVDDVLFDTTSADSLVWAVAQPTTQPDMVYQYHFVHDMGFVLGDWKAFHE